jgi:ribosomal protein S18 acetylase RimI-like enzyme
MTNNFNLMLRSKNSFNKNIRFANALDVVHLKNELESNFNKEIEQLPELFELEQSANNRNILLYEIDGEVYGFLIFHKNGKTMNLKYWYVDTRKRDLRIGSQLFEQFLMEGNDCIKFQLWVIRTNTNAIKRYIHYGFKEENMYNFVLKKHETTNN